jgi:hypothetical protein
MVEKSIQTHLVKKRSQFPTVCISCNRSIEINEPHYVEEGITGHIHSLIARKYCSECYMKHGEQLLFRGNTA